MKNLIREYQIKWANGIVELGKTKGDIITSKKTVANRDANLKYIEPSPFHFGLSHSNPSTLINVFFLKILVNIPNGPFAELTTKTISFFEKHTWINEKKELYNCENTLDLIEGV